MLCDIFFTYNSNCGDQNKLVFFVKYAKILTQQCVELSRLLSNACLYNV
jgi:hypothetical protein